MSTPTDSQRIAHLEAEVATLKKVITEALGPFRPVAVDLRVGGAHKRPWVILAAPAPRQLEVMSRNGLADPTVSDSAPSDS